MADINFIDNVGLGKVNGWSDKKDIFIMPITFPGKDSGKVEGVDTMGTSAVTEITGRITGTFKILQNTIQSIKGIADGFQINSVKLQSPFVCYKFFTSADAEQTRQGNMGKNTTAFSYTLFDSNALFQSWNIQPGDIVKNLQTGSTASVVTITSETGLTLDTDVFPTSGGTGVPYAVTATINVKVTGFETNWETPGLTYVDYKLTILQVK